MIVNDKSHLNTGVETVERDGIRYAEIIWANTQVPITKFFSPSDSSFQFGLLAHDAGFVEPPHFHKPVSRVINDLQQMFVVQRGKVAVQLFTEQGEMFREIILQTGDAILLIHGIHAVRAVEDFQCISVKQGPFLGAENDKVNVEVKSNQ
ncbi:MAG TPA: hypothetical protein VFD63_04760 [Pyrinomonadaceae bacterium]|nr:hypothetical protein [Pyrinomonadaceae bacterium]